MEKETDKNTEFKDRFIFLIKENKIKILLIFTIFLVSVISIIALNIYKEKKNNLISEKYIQAGLYLANGKKIESKNLYKEIVLSKNNFYSILALNTIIEKNLENDEGKVIEYFEILENLKLSKSQKDLIEFKKALFLIEGINFEEGKKLIEKIVESDSSFKDLAKEILPK